MEELIAKHLESRFGQPPSEWQVQAACRAVELVASAAGSERVPIAPFFGSPTASQIVRRFRLTSFVLEEATK